MVGHCNFYFLLFTDKKTRVGGWGGWGWGGGPVDTGSVRLVETRVFFTFTPKQL